FPPRHHGPAVHENRKPLPAQDPEPDKSGRDHGGKRREHADLAAHHDENRDFGEGDRQYGQEDDPAHALVSFPRTPVQPAPRVSRFEGRTVWTKVASPSGCIYIDQPPAI